MRDVHAQLSDWMRRVGMHVCRRYDAYDLGTDEAAEVSSRGS